MANIYEPSFDDAGARDGFAYRDAWLGHQAGARRLGASLYEVDPGSASFSYHWHAGNEELLMVVRGTVTLRTPEGERQVGEGEVVAFPRGERGAHQMINDTDEPVRFVVFSEMRGPDVIANPDAGKIGARSEAPGSGRGGIRLSFLEDDAVDYLHGDQPPRQ